jgi:signal recognition particle GTPase
MVAAMVGQQLSMQVRKFNSKIQKKLQHLMLKKMKVTYSIGSAFKVQG